MALPELLLPPTLPDFKAAGHTATPEKMYGAVERQGGTERKRRLYTITPRRLQAQLEVTQAQLEIFVDWHENTLKAGSEPFTAKVAKVGAGVEYWEAHCLSFTVDHQEGSTHLISLELRLKGTPSDSLPTLSSLGAEFLAGLAVQVDGGYAYGLSADFVAGLGVVINEGAALSAEFLARLDTVTSGALANPSLLAEFAAALDCYSIVGSSAALAAEFSAGLDAYTLDVPALAAEFTAALACSTTASSSLGYRNPATVDVDADFAYYKQSTTVTVRITPDGTVYTKSHTAAYVLVDYFYSPATAGVAAGKWVRATLLSGDASNLSPTIGTARQFDTSTPLNWVLIAYWQEGSNTQSAQVQIQIANDPDFLDVVSAFTANMSAAWLGV